jgi:hypothetical protein
MASLYESFWAISSPRRFLRFSPTTKTMFYMSHSFFSIKYSNHLKLFYMYHDFSIYYIYGPFSHHTSAPSTSPPCCAGSEPRGPNRTFRGPRAARHWRSRWAKGCKDVELKHDTILFGGLEHVLFFHILGISSSQLTKSIIFQRGRFFPPTRIWYNIRQHEENINEY